MSHPESLLLSSLCSRFKSVVQEADLKLGEITLRLDRKDLIATMTSLRDEEPFIFDQLIDVCGIDYSEYGMGAWQGPRFGVIYHLLSVAHNQRLRIKVWLEEDDVVVPSVVEIWKSADWFEREAFDLFGILFEGHADLRRILTDYGFIGHPFRKDFPLTGHVEMRYDPDKQRVVYEPVSIEPRILEPRVIRKDSRYVDDQQAG